MFVSPLKRCLETAEWVLKDIESDFKIIVLPLIMEGVETQGEFPKKIHDSMKKYLNFDFSIVKEKMKNYEEFLFIEYLMNEELKDKFSQILYQSKKENRDLKWKTEEYIKVIKNSLLENKKLESNKNVFDRAQVFKNYMKDFIKKNNLKDNEVLVVSHNNFGKGLTAKSVETTTDSYIDYVFLQNAQMIEINI